MLPFFSLDSTYSLKHYADGVCVCVCVYVHTRLSMCSVVGSAVCTVVNRMPCFHPDYTVLPREVFTSCEGHQGLPCLLGASVCAASSLYSRPHSETPEVGEALSWSLACLAWAFPLLHLSNLVRLDSSRQM